MTKFYSRIKIVQKIKRYLKSKNNVIIHGVSGVGKSALINSLIEDYNLKDLNKLVNNTDKIEINKSDVFIIDDFGEDNLSSLKQVLKNNQVIIITTELDKMTSKLSTSIMKKFKKLNIEEPTIKETINILKHSHKDITKKYNINIDINLYDYIVKICKDNIKDIALPESPMNIIEDSINYIITSENEEPLELLEKKEEFDLQKKIYEADTFASKDTLEKNEEHLDKIIYQMDKIEEKINIEKEILKKIKKARLMKNKAKVKMLKLELEKLETRYVYTELDKQLIKKMVEEHIGYTLTKKDLSKVEVKLKEPEKETQKLDIKNLDKMISNEVIGQDNAIKELSQLIKRSYVGFGDENQPIASAILTGSTGVGKTETAKVLNKILFGEEVELVRFDMSEYQEKHTVSKLIGASTGYVGYEDGSLLTKVVSKNKKRVILFDEVEKAHPDLYDVLLQVLDDGRLTDNKGKTYSYRDTIILFTTNLKQEDLKRFFRAEFLNRLDLKLHFNSLTREDISKIFDKLIKTTLKKCESKNINTTITKSCKEFICKVGFDSENGARPLNRAIKSYIENLIVDSLLEEEIKENDIITIDFVDNNIKIIKG